MVRRPASVLALLAFALAFAAPGLTAQDGEGEGWRFGFSVGGVSTVGIVLERIGDWGRFEVLLGTWAFRDLSVSTVYKNTIGGGDFRAVAGLGLWTVLAFPADERPGVALVARAPFGFEWELQDDQFLGAELGFSRALAIRRTDPEDDRPPASRIVPLPGASYRWRR